MTYHLLQQQMAAQAAATQAAYLCQRCNTTPVPGPGWNCSACASYLAALARGDQEVGKLLARVFKRARHAAQLATAKGVPIDYEYGYRASSQEVASGPKGSRRRVALLLGWVVGRDTQERRLVLANSGELYLMPCTDPGDWPVDSDSAQRWIDYARLTFDHRTVIAPQDMSVYERGIDAFTTSLEHEPHPGIG